jgi:RNA polymerase sigma factor (sigma-70 family)
MEIGSLSFQERSPEIYRQVMLAKEGNEKAMAFLLERYRKSLMSMIFKMVRNKDDAEDLMMETFAKAFRNLHRYEARFAFSTWLFKIGTNHTIDFIRQKKLRAISLSHGFSDGNGDVFTIDVPSGDRNPEQDILRSQDHEILRKIVDQLPAKYEALVRMKYFEELSIEEIRVQTGQPVNTIKIQLFRARNLILEIMEGKRKPGKS